MPEPKRTLTFTFGWPPRELSPNIRTKTVVLADGTRKRKAIHWREVGAATKAYREQCGWAAVEPAIDPETHVTICLHSPVLATTTFHVKDKIRRDMKNMEAALKPLWDGIVDAGVLQDDSTEHLRHAESKLVVGKERKVVVVLEEMG